MGKHYMGKHSRVRGRHAKRSRRRIIWEYMMDGEVLLLAFVIALTIGMMLYWISVFG